MTEMKILLAVDGSRHSLNAVKYLIEHAGWYREMPAVQLVNVRLPVPKIGGMGAVIGVKQIQRYYHEEGRKALSKARKLLDSAGITYSANIFVGPVAETLLKEAKFSRCDLIMIGTRGMTAVGNLLMGSTAAKVMNLSTIPVLLVK